MCHCVGGNNNNNDTKKRAELANCTPLGRPGDLRSQQDSYSQHWRKLGAGQVTVPSADPIYNRVVLKARSVPQRCSSYLSTMLISK